MTELQSTVIADEDRIFHARVNPRIKRTLCGLSTINANEEWPKDHVYLDKDILIKKPVVGRICESCLPHTASLRNPAPS